MWALLCVAINTGPWDLAAFGEGIGETVNALRASLPLIVCGLALLLLTTKSQARPHSWVELGFWTYGVIMLLACTGSDVWFDQAYWGVAFLATLAVVELGLRNGRPLAFITRLNWLTWTFTVCTLVTMLLLARSVLYDPEAHSAYAVASRFEETRGYLISRSSGFSRMAAIPAIIALVFLLSGRLWQRILSAAVLAGCIYIIWIMQSRGAFFAFAGTLLVIPLFGEKRVANMCVVLGVLLLGYFWLVYSEGGLQDFWLHVTRGYGAAGFSDMSGRNVIWQDVVDRWWGSPVFGYGPQADRLFSVNAQNAVLYALLSAGLLGVVFFVIANLSSWRALLRTALRTRRLSAQERTMFQITSGILVFSTLRSSPENEAALYSVDLLLQYSAMLYLVLLANKAKAQRIASSSIGRQVDPACSLSA